MKEKKERLILWHKQKDIDFNESQTLENKYIVQKLEKIENQKISVLIIKNVDFAFNLSQNAFKILIRN
jgi:hypothetical protein